MKKIGLWILVLSLGWGAFADDNDNPPGGGSKTWDECNQCYTATNTCDGCVMTWINLGKNHPGSALPESRLQVFAEDPSPALYTPQALTFIGGWSIQSVSSDRTEAGAPRTVHMFDSKGQSIEYDFEDDESTGLPNDHLIDERRFTRLFMVDAEGWATLSEPAYYDLYTKDGDLYRFYAHSESEHYLELCYYKTATGYEETFEDAGVEIIKESGDILRQVRTATQLANIIIESSSKYRVDCYADADVSSPDSNGVYSVSGGAEPLVTWVFENPEPGGHEKLRVSKISGSFTNVFDYIYEAELEDWTLIKGDGLQKTVREKYWNDAYTVEEITETIQDEADQIVSEKIERNEMLPFGKARTQTRVNTGSEWLTTQYSYYTDPSEPGRYGSLKSKEWADGSWEAYDYDVAGRITLKEKPYKDSEMGDSGVREFVYGYTPHVSNATALAVDHRPRTVTEKINGVVAAITFHSYVTNGLGETVETTEQALSQSAIYGDAGSLRTIRTYYASGDDLKGRLKTVQHPDGRIDTYTYERGTYAASSNPAECAFATNSSGLAWRETIVYGITNNAVGVANLSPKERIGYWPRKRFGETWNVETG